MTRSTATLEVVPAIDLLAGRVVRLFQGDFDQVTAYESDPVELALRYAAAGARRLHVVDLDGARTGKPVNLPIIEALARLDLEVQAGGGVRDRARLDTLLDAGVSRVVVGSVAVTQRDVVAGWLDAVGAGRVIPAVDIRLGADGEPELLTHGWTAGSGKSLWPLVEFYVARGAMEFLCTDVARDGTLGGPNLELYAACVQRFPSAGFIASGGVGGANDLKALQAIGIACAVTGKALLDGGLGLEELKPFWRNA